MEEKELVVDESIKQDVFEVSFPNVMKEQDLPVSNEMESDKEEYVKTKDISTDFHNPEEKLKYIKNLSPDVKAAIVFNLLTQAGKIRAYGHEKRIVMRKLEREAKKGRLDRFFLEK